MPTQLCAAETGPPVKPKRHPHDCSCDHGAANRDTNKSNEVEVICVTGNVGQFALLVVIALRSVMGVVGLLAILLAGSRARRRGRHSLVASRLHWARRHQRKAL